MCLILLSGCQLARLLSFKEQLKNFDKNFEFKSNHSVLMKNPVLIDYDILTIAGSKPRQITQNGNRVVWHYFLKKVPTEKQPSSEAFDLKTKLTFVDGKLQEFDYPKPISKLFSAQMVHLGFKSIGKGSFDASSRKITPSLPKKKRSYSKTDIPSKRKIKSHLGEPNKVVFDKEYEVWVFQYHEISDTNTVTHTPWIKAGFKKGKESIAYISGTIIGPHIQFWFE